MTVHPLGVAGEHFESHDEAPFLPMRWAYFAWVLLVVFCITSIDAFAAPRPHLGRRNFQKGARKAPFRTNSPPPIATNVGVASVGANARLQKVIAHSGLASRRTAEEMIQDGRVSVNGKLTTDLGIRVNSKVDRIVVDGKKLSLPDVKSTFWVAVNKPKDLLTTMRDEKDRDTVLSLVPKAQELHLMPVGGLDRDFTGLMILTNEIGWIHYMTHPAYPHNNRYEVLVKGLPSEEQLDILREGVVLPGERTRCTPCTVNVVDVDRKSQQSIVNILVDERRAMQLERMLEHIDCKVISMKRIEFCGVRLKGLRKGAWRELTPGEVNSLKLNCNPAAGLAQGYAAAAARTAQKTSANEGYTDNQKHISKPNMDKAHSSARTNHRDSPLVVRQVKAPHRLRPAFRDSSPSESDQSQNHNEPYILPGTSKNPPVHRKFNKLSTAYDKKEPSVKAPAENNMPVAKARRVFDDSFTPQTVRKNAYDRKFTPPKKAHVEETYTKHSDDESLPKRRVMGAARWLGRANEKDAFKVGKVKKRTKTS